MAQRKNDPPSNSEKATVRVFFAEVTGNNESVKEAFRTMVAAMGRPVHISAPRAVGNGGAQPALPSEPETTDGEVEEVLAREDNSYSTNTSDAGSATPRKRGTGPKVDRNAGIKMVTDVNFVPSDKPSLEVFFKEKAARTDMEMIVVIAYYMQQTLAVTAIGPGHILAGFKDVDEQVPLDLRGTLRNMRRDKGWLAFTDIEAIRVTTAGENYVQHKIGKQADAD